MTRAHEQIGGNPDSHAKAPAAAIDATASVVTAAEAMRRPEKKKRLPRRYSRDELMGEPESPESIKVITIAGDTFTGKTGCAEKTVGGGSFPPEDFFLVGEKIRAVENSGQGPQRRVKRSREVDIKFDKEQQAMIRSGRRIFIESRLASILVSRMRTEEPEREINAVSVLLTASKEVRQVRAFRRALINRTKDIANLEKALATSVDTVERKGLKAEKSALEDVHYTEDNVWEMEKNRTQNDEKWYRRIYPWFNEEIPGDFLNPDLTIRGQRVYDIVIDTNGVTPQEVYRLTCEAIILFRKNRNRISTVVGTNTFRKMGEKMWVRRGAHGQLWVFGKAPGKQAA
jgi:cytidylate kinase